MTTNDHTQTETETEMMFETFVLSHPELDPAEAREAFDQDCRAREALQSLQTAGFASAPEPDPEYEIGTVLQQAAAVIRNAHDAAWMAHLGHGAYLVCERMTDATVLDGVGHPKWAPAHDLAMGLLSFTDASDNLIDDFPEPLLDWVADTVTGILLPA